MSSTDQEAAARPEDVVRRVWPGRDFTLEPLGGGITNRNFVVRVESEAFVLRIGGKDTHLLGIDRFAEEAAARMAAEVGVGPDVVAFVEPEGYLVTRFVQGTPITPDRMREPETIGRVGSALRAIHGGPAIPGRFDAHRVVEDHDPNGAGTHVLPDMAVTAPGNIDVVWYGSTATGEPNGVCGTITNQSPCKDGFPSFNKPNAPAWNVYMAQSRNVLTSTPRFRQVVVNPTPTHYGRICTNGIVCGSSDRTLLDFISVAVDCNGLAHIAYAGNTKEQEETGKAFVHVARQVGGSTIAPPATCG